MSRICRSLLESAAPGTTGGRRLFRRGALLAGAALLASAASGLAQRPANPPAAGARIAAIPAVVHTAVADSGQGNVVEVRNEGTAPAQLRFYLGDFEQNENGDFTFLPFGKGSHTCGEHLSVFPDGVVLRGGERAQIQLRLSGGAGVCWGLMFVESLPQGQGPIKVIQRIGVKLLNSPPGATVSGEVASVTVQRLKGDSVGVKTIFRNTGQTPLELRGRVEIRDYTGKVMAQAELGPLGSYPGRDRIVEVAVPVRLPRGDYVAVPIIDFGGDYLAGGQATLRVP